MTSSTHAAVDSGIDFAKGHGTENDFILLPDPQARLPLPAEAVVALCDRRRGVGADGVLRVARAGALVEAGVLASLPAGVGAEDWFMDYRNGDGSVAEMCGNGVRVFAHYLVATGRQRSEQFVVGSRAGGRPVVVHSGGGAVGDVTVEMGPVRVLGASKVTLGERVLAGLGVDVGNPHLACLEPQLTTADLAAMDVAAPPSYDHSFFPDGVNVEVVVPVAEAAGTVAMRVHERGVGETRSCGTGTVAAAVAAVAAEGGQPEHDHARVCVRVTGGEVQVTLDQGQASLRGPSVLVASGHLAAAWWNSYAQ